MYLEQFLPFMIRVILGALLFFQSYEILVRIGINETCRTVLEGTRERKIPDWFSKISVYFSTYIQLIGGLLLILGLFTPIVMIIIGINLMMVTIGFGFLKGIWDMQHVFPRLILLIILFFINLESDVLSLDYVFNIKSLFLNF